ncbi:hyaluronate lyase precursor [Xenorhabdus sp. PB62.4]|nr:hyaluronate lyase precursor [Xenorhabdus sp. PB62.4]
MEQVGANQADFAYIQLFWSISGWKNTGLSSFLNDAYAASDSTSSLCFPVSRHGKENGQGISVDNSFSQHNPQAGKYSQLYAGSYGTVLLSNIFKIQAILYGVFSLNEDAIKSLENFMINGMGWFSYAKLYDFQVCGRAISRKMNGSSALASWCQQLMDCNPRRPEILQEIIRRAQGDESRNNYYLGSRAYWVNDYMTHISEKYCLWAKVVSTRTVGGESGNGENLKGYYMGCGSYFISRTGGEYFNIQPVWEWQRIPGTTVEQVPGFNYPLIDWGYNNWGSDDFAGAISDGDIGITSMMLTRKNIKNAKKSVVALPDKSVFMGSSIDISHANNAVYTSVNQCIINGDITVYYNDGTQEKLPLGGKKRSNNIIQVTHDGLRYDFPNTQTVTVQAITQTGCWHDINKGGSSDIVSKNVFSIWIEHANGNAGEYYYEITNTENTKPTSQTQFIYTDNAHIVTDIEKRTAAAVIFSNNEDAVLLNSVEIKALTPIAYIATVRDDGILNLTIADLSQKLTKVDFCFTWGDITSLTSFPLPGGDNKGKSITYLVGPITGDKKNIF